MEQCERKQECDRRLTWNPSSCECEYKKKQAYLLVEKCKENIDENEIIYNKTFNKRVQ